VLTAQDKEKRGPSLSCHAMSGFAFFYATQERRETDRL